MKPKTLQIKKILASIQNFINGGKQCRIVTLQSFQS